MPELESLLLDFAIIVLCVYIAFGFFLYFFQKSIIYHPTKQDFNDCSGFKDSEKIVEKGTRMYHGSVSDKLIVYYHGNAGSACDRDFIKDKFKSMGYSYLFVEYAGYSNDDKKPSKELLLQDVENAQRVIEEKDYEEVAIIGSSLGSAMASYHTKISRVDKLILIGGFHSFLDVAERVYPFYPVKWLLRENYDNSEYLEGYGGSLLMLQPEKDTVIPVESGKRLYDSLELEDKEFVKLEAGHNDVFSEEEMWEKMKYFLEK